MLVAIQVYIILMIMINLVLILRSREFNKLDLWKKIVLLFVSPLLLIRETLNEIVGLKKREK